MSDSMYFGISTGGIFAFSVAVCAIPLGEAVASHCPIVLDFEHSGSIEVSGGTTSLFEQNIGNWLGRVVQFDIDGDGNEDWIEWLSSPEDAFLVDNRDGMASTELDGNRLFRNASPDHENGFEKLSELDANRDGVVSGEELNGLVLWFDANLDAKFQEGEFKSVGEVGLLALNTQYEIIESVDDSSRFISNAETTEGPIFVEDVFFGSPTDFGLSILDSLPVLSKFSGFIS